MDGIAVTFDFIPFKKGLEAAYRDQIPFAISQALNDVGFASRTEINHHIRRTFIVRRPWITRQTHVDKSTKKKLWVEIGSRADFLALHATGGVKRPPSGRSSVSIPTPNLVSKNRVPSRKTQWPKPLVSRSKPSARVFFSKHALMQSRKGEAPRPLWLFRKDVRIRPVFKLKEQVESVMFRKWNETVLKRLDEALATRR